MMNHKIFNLDIVEHRSKPPLRWFANICGNISGWAIMPIAILDEQNNFGFKYKLYSFIWRITWPIYYKFGTFYEFDFDMSGDGWNDYDENDVPYWEKTGTIDPYIVDDIWNNKENIWDYIDEETGDAFRLIKNGIK